MTENDPVVKKNCELETNELSLFGANSKERADVFDRLLRSQTTTKRPAIGDPARLVGLGAVVFTKRTQALSAVLKGLLTV